MDCNRCRMNRLRRRAESEGKIVETRPANFGVNVYVREKHEKLNTASPDDDENSHFKMWFMSLPPSCRC